MFGAVWAAGGFATTEGKFRISRVTDRPFAHAVAQCENGRSFAIGERLWWQRGEHGHFLVRLQIRLGHNALRLWRDDAAIWLDPRLRTGETRRTFDRTRWGGAARQAKPMHLADDGISGHPAKFLCDLTGRMAFRPKFFENFYPIFRPSHAFYPALWQPLDIDLSDASSPAPTLYIVSAAK